MVAVLHRAGREFLEDHCLTLAAAISYYSVFSLPSLLLIAVYVAGLIYGKAAAAERIAQHLTTVFGAGAASQVKEIIYRTDDPQGSVWVTVLSLGFILISATTSFSVLQRILNRVWEVENTGALTRRLAMKRLVSLGVVLSLGILLTLSLTLAAVTARFPQLLDLPAWVFPFVQTAGAWLALTALTAAMFKLLPDAEIEWRDVAVSGAVAAGLLVAGKFVLSLILSRLPIASAFGAAGSLALLLVWIYFSAAMILFGAEFAPEWAKLHGRQVLPQDGAVRIVKKRLAPEA